jgi:hypothetical protein
MKHQVNQRTVGFGVGYLDDLSAALAVMGTMPGQSGDAPGTVRLHDRSGRVLRETDVDMVQRVDHVEWDADSVHVKLVADWPLRE